MKLSTYGLLVDDMGSKGSNRKHLNKTISIRVAL